jgi:23S rRNA (cytosine1962-C5)-methyltransferase
MKESLQSLLEKALSPRQSYIDGEHQIALRLFAGFYEGEPRLIADVFASTLLLTVYCEIADEARSLLTTAQDFYLGRLPWLTCVIQKQRLAKDLGLKRGQITFGSQPAERILENSLYHAVDLTLNQDASFYLDTRELRDWLRLATAGLDVLNTFAYTGSLGVAALAGGAAHVLQVDRNGRFLELARRSAMANHLDLGRMKLCADDVFNEIGSLKKAATLFDMVFLDPPFFSVTEKGKVDLVSESTRIINKLRPLVKDNGRLVVINNALFLSGMDYFHSLEELCQDGYLKIDQIIPVPADVTGFPETIVARPPSDPAPFNHPTKIVVLRVHRKDH